MDKILLQIKSCSVCKNYLEFGVNPVIAASEKSKIIIVGQAPGRMVHRSGIPWDDKSGDNLRKWLGMDKDTFYDADKIALIPMGFCYPGKGKSGDLPPRAECAPLWHHQLLSRMPQVELIVLVGLYAQKYYLGDRAKGSLTETVKNFRTYLPAYLPVPHPSPRNNIWQKKNEWFGEEVLPEMKKLIQAII